MNNEFMEGVRPKSMHGILCSTKGNVRTIINGHARFKALEELASPHTTLKHWLMLSYFHAVASDELKSHCRLPLPGHCLESILERGGLTLDEMELLEEEYANLRFWNKNGTTGS